MADRAALSNSERSQNAVEQACVVLLNASGQTLKQLLYEGSLDAVHLPMREIIQEVLNSQCAGIILMHNHPSGCLQPSPADIAVTRSLYGVLTPLGVKLLDHVITGPNGSFSFREQGLL